MVTDDHEQADRPGHRQHRPDELLTADTGERADLGPLGDVSLAERESTQKRHTDAVDQRYHRNQDRIRVRRQPAHGDVGGEEDHREYRHRHQEAWGERTQQVHLDRGRVPCHHHHGEQEQPQFGPARAGPTTPTRHRTRRGGGGTGTAGAVTTCCPDYSVRQSAGSYEREGSGITVGLGDGGASLGSSLGEGERRWRGSGDGSALAWPRSLALA